MLREHAPNVPVRTLDRQTYVTSDQHVQPKVFYEVFRDLKAYEKGGPRTSLLNDYSWLTDSILGPDQAKRSIWLGDTVHIRPNFKMQSEAVPAALSSLTEHLVKHNISGESFNWIPGNHDPITHWPEDVCTELSARGIAIPEKKMILSDQDNGIDYYLMHGDSEEPPLYNIPFTEYPTVSRTFDNFLLLAHRIRLLNKKDGPYPISPLLQKVLNSPQKRWNHRHLDPRQVRITGHTHVRELDLDEQYGNTGHKDGVFGWLSGIFIHQTGLILYNTNLNSGIYKPGAITNIDSTATWKQIEYTQEQLWKFGQRLPLEENTKGVLFQEF